MSETLAFVERLDPQGCRLKVGKELFTAYGPEIIKALHKKGFEIFLDLKFHDIPNTVYRAVQVAAGLGVWMLNVHASGGREMLLKARQAIDESDHQPLLIGVTLLTSLNAAAVDEIAYRYPLAEQVLHLAKLSFAAGLDGVVCSAHEADAVKQSTHAQFLIVTPGIRLQEGQTDDQTRIMTPEAALRNGADYLVIGRPLTRADNPQAILSQLNSWH